MVFCLMKKRGFVGIILVLFLVQIVAGQLNDASSLVVDANVSFGFFVNEEIKNLSANITYFPREGKNAQVTKLEITSVPESRLVSRGEEHMLIEWPVTLGEGSFKVDGTIRNRVGEKAFGDVSFSGRDLEKYMAATKFINADDKEIRKTALEIVGGEENNLKRVVKLALWTRENVKYDLSSLTVEASLPARKVLESREGVCDEITILFIAFARSLGIPARYVSGIVYADAFKEKWVPHAWAEVWMNGEWVPFDVTLGQLGWVDPTHVGMKASEDVDYSSIVYKWASEKGRVVPKGVKVNAVGREAVASSGEGRIVGVRVLEDRVFLGSVVPVEVEVVNPSEKFVFDVVSLRGAAVVGFESIPVFLSPQEGKKIFFLARVPREGVADVEMKVEVKDSMNNVFVSSLVVGKKYKFVSLEEAELLVRKSLVERDELPLLGLECLSEKNENKILKCQVENKDVKDARKVKICKGDECVVRDVKARGKERVEFSWGGEVLIMMEYEGREEKHVISALDEKGVVKIGDVSCPKRLGYGEKARMVVGLEAEEFVEEVYLTVEGLLPYKVKDFKGKQVVVLPVRGNYFAESGGLVKISVNYNDVEGSRLSVESSCKIEIGEVPWWEKVFLRVREAMSF